MMLDRTRTFAAAAALCLAVSGLAACGQSNNTSEPPETPPTSTEPAPETPVGAGPEGSVMVGGAAMLPSRTIVENASESKDHTTLVAAVTAAGLGGTLSGEGPFTVFAPTNAAFEKLPDGTVETLTQPAQKQQLTGILTYHVVPGRLTAADLTRQIQEGGGTASLTTVQGGKLTARAANGGVQITDAAGGTSMVTQADVMQSNGVVHVVDTVLMPAAG